MRASLDVEEARGLRVLDKEYRKLPQLVTSPALTSRCSRMCSEKVLTTAKLRARTEYLQAPHLVRNDEFFDGPRIRPSTVADYFTREGVAEKMAPSIRGQVRRASPQRLKRQRRLPQTIRRTTARSSRPGQSGSGPPLWEWAPCTSSKVRRRSTGTWRVSTAS